MGASDRPKADGMHRTALDIFAGLATSYERAVDLATLTQDRYWKRWVMDEARIGRAQRVLDLGCGTCLFEQGLEVTGCRVVGLDLTEQMVRIGKSKDLACLDGLLVGDAESLPFAAGVFDCVVSCYLVKYVNIAKLGGEVGRVLKPGGRVVLYDFIRPRGAFSFLVRLYVHGGMRIAGFLLGLLGNQAAVTFRKIPSIVEGARWNEAVSDAFLAAGVQMKTARSLSGGVVGAFSGIRVTENRP